MEAHIQISPRLYGNNNINPSMHRTVYIYIFFIFEQLE
jgi:hypothetical protein